MFEENEIQAVLDRLEKLVGCPVFWDDSRMWTLGYRDGGRVYGAQRGYLGGGMRGAIRSNIEVDSVREAFVDGLKEIEGIYNRETEGLESWEQNTGVLL